MANSYYDGPPSDHFDGERFFLPGQSYNNSFLRFLSWRFGNKPAPWPTSFPSPFSDKPPEREVKGQLRVTFIGHASFLIQADNLNILIDPVYSERASPFTFAGPKRVNAPGIAFDALPPIDAVLVTHGHYDHLDVATLKRLERRFRPQFVCPLGNDAIMRQNIGRDARIMAGDWGDSVEIGNGIRAHLEPSYHWSARGLRDRRKQLWCAFVIETGAGKLYHIGDTGYGDGQLFRDVKARHGAIRLAHIPIGAYEPRWFMQKQHVNPEEAVRILTDCGAEQAIGHHWGTFQLTDEAIERPPQELAQALDAGGIAPSRFEPFRPGQVKLFS